MWGLSLKLGTGGEILANLYFKDYEILSRPPPSEHGLKPEIKEYAVSWIEWAASKSLNQGIEDTVKIQIIKK